jgi:hypothetical protein
MPRLDYSGGASCPSLLLEPSRTNLIGYSEYLLDGWSDTGCTITKTSETNPSGKNISYFATAIDSPNADRIRYFGGTKTGDYCFSFFAKGDGNANQIYLRALGVQDGTAVNMYWDVAADGTISFNATDSDANGSPITENYGNGWYRIGFKQTFTGANAYSDIRPSSGDINAGIYVWGVQWEAGSYPTSYIPTYGSSVTRNNDTSLVAGVSDIIGQTEGTLYFEAAVMGVPTDTQRLISLSNGTTNESIQIQVSGGSDKLAYVVLEGGVQQMVFTSVDITLGTTFKTAIAYAENDFAVYLNGTLVGTDNSGNVPVDMDKIVYGRGNETQFCEGEIKQTMIFKTRLLNEELAALTTI